MAYVRPAPYARVESDFVDARSSGGAYEALSANVERRRLEVVTTSEGKAQVVPNVLSWLAEASRISGLLGILTPELRAHSHTLGPWQRTPNFQDRSPHCVIINAHHVTSLVFSYCLITYSTLLLIGHATSMRNSKIRVDGPASTRC